MKLPKSFTPEWCLFVAGMIVLLPLYGSASNKGALGDALNPFLALIGVLLVVRQIRMSSERAVQEQREEARGRAVDVIRLVSDWLEPTAERELRGRTYEDPIFTAKQYRKMSESPIAVDANEAKKRVKDGGNLVGVLEGLIAQLDRVGAFLRNVPAGSIDSVLQVYSAAFVRSGCVLLPYVELFRQSRGDAYGKNLLWLVRAGLARLDKDAVLRMHEKDDLSNSYEVPLLEIRNYLDRLSAPPYTA